jgi:hypothetical protein
VTRGTMRTLLRRRRKDVAAINWTDSELNELLNEAAGYVQKEVMKVDPTAFLKITRQHIKADVDRYAKPQGIWSLLDVAKKDTSTGRYVSLGTPVDFLTIRGLQASTGSTATRFALFGEEILIGPTPDSDLDDGLEWVWVSSATMSEDDDVLGLHIALHQAVVLRAEILLAPETASPDVTTLEKILAKELEDIPTYYRRTVGAETPLMPGIDKGY